MKFIRIGIYYLLGVFGIICISVFSKFFATNGIANPIDYFKDLIAFVLKFMQPDFWVYKLADADVELPLLETIWEPYIYSMQIFLGAILLGFILAFLLTLLASYIPQPMLKGLKRSLDLLESVPDLVIAVLLQALSVYAYKNWDLDLFRIAGYGDEKIYFAPIVTLAFLPMISLFKIMILHVEEEFTKDYVVFVKSKGIHKARVLLNHIFRNVLPTAFQHSKIIIWSTLSSQFIIEYLFNINGLTFFIIDSFTPMTIAVSLILVFTPFLFSFSWLSLGCIKIRLPVRRH